MIKYAFLEHAEQISSLFLQYGLKSIWIYNHNYPVFGKNNFETNFALELYEP